MSEYFSLHHSIINSLQDVNALHLPVLLVLIEREGRQRSLKIGLSLSELARTADVSDHVARQALLAFEALGWFTVEKKSKHHVIKLSSWLTGNETVPIPFVFDNTDVTKILKLEQELRRTSAQTPRYSGLTDIYKGEERDLYLEIENRGYSITLLEANLLGKMVAKFGVERVKQTYRQMQTQKNAIRATYASLQRGIKGGGAKFVETEPFKKVTYREVE